MRLRLHPAATAVVLAIVLPLLPLPGAAQEPASVELRVRPESGAATLRIGNLLEERSLRGALESGLPLRILIVAELWRKRFFDAQEGRFEWRASVVYDPLAREYRVETGNGEVFTTASLDEARLALQQSFEPPLRPGPAGRYYYLATVEVETLSLSDLEELRRWLRGDLATVVSGEAPVEGALERGFRRLFVRVLALPVQRYRIRSPTFRHDP